MTDYIELYGVRTNNLKNLTCKIPMHAITVVTGVSGSGKSSLAFDTLYAEGQRRFLESMSTYVRMFLDEMPKPPVDRTENCLPAIALRQQSSFDHPRSTVCTVTELLLFITQLFAHMGEHRCHICGHPIARDTNDEIRRRLDAFGEKIKAVIYVEMPLSEGESAAQKLTALAAGGYQRLWWQNKVVELSSLDIEQWLDASQFPVLIDRIVYHPEKGIDGRLTEAIEEAFKLGDDQFCIDILLPDHVETLRFNRRETCRNCGTSYPKLRPEYFDPNASLGACPVCTGFGAVSGIDWTRVFDRHQSLLEGAVVPFRPASATFRKKKLFAFCGANHIPIDVPFESLTPKQVHLITHGDRQYKGVMDYFDHLMSHANKFTSRIQLARFRGYTPCDSCKGSGLGSIASHVFLYGKTCADVLKMTVAEALSFFSALDKNDVTAVGAMTAWEETCARLQTLSDVGLDYLPLNRRTKTLSGGECQRLHLSCGLGRGLSDTLYVLDEPTAGLHTQDSQKLISVMKSLKALGNTLVVVEHDTDVISAADHIIEMGPCGGEKGGYQIYTGSLNGLYQSDTPTGHYIQNDARLSLNATPKPSKKTITIEHAVLHNLKDLSLSIPLNQIVVIAGVSGSGKSTLIHDVLYQSWQLDRSAPSDDKETSEQEFDIHAKISGLEAFDDVVMMQQGALGRSTRACVATMSSAFTEIRSLLSRQPRAKELGFQPKWFSFNVEDGRCPECEGLGIKKIEMMFLNDLSIPCPECGGKRFIPDVLSVTYNGKNISDILDMTIDEARVFFEKKSGISNPLSVLSSVGLGYIRLGQATSTLSGGEFQRLKLAGYLDHAKADNSKTLFIFDEPTVGLHMQDIECLEHAIKRLTDTGGSVIIIEHNLDIIAHADHVIELGPVGGPNGGNILFQGVPAELAQRDSPTGRALRLR